MTARMDNGPCGHGYGAEVYVMALSGVSLDQGPLFLGGVTSYQYGPDQSRSDGGEYHPSEYSTAPSQNLYGDFDDHT